MLIKFLDHSTGSGRAAIRYLLGEKDHQGNIRAGVNVLRGNPQQVGELIDSLQFVHRYSSGVIAFHPDDKPTKEEIEELLNEIERISFAGLEPNQYTWSAVQHIENDGSTHIHFVSPRVELTTGKAMNIAPPGWQKRFDALRDAFNFEKGWARPEDPRLARAVQPGSQGSYPNFKNGDHPKNQITEWLTTQIISGHINDRSDVIEALSELGEINRQGKNYLSIRIDESAKPIRLKGPIYEQQFDVETLRKTATEAQRRPGGREPTNSGAAAVARRELEKAVQKFSLYNQGRYGQTQRAFERVTEAEFGELQKNVVVAASGQPHGVGASSFVGSGLELVESQPGRRDSSSEIESDRTGRAEVLRKPSRSNSLRNIEEIKDDRARTITERAVRAAGEGARAAAQAISQCAAAASLAYQGIVRACRIADSATTKLRVNMDAELDRFKNEISLTDFAQSMFGYELIKKESSANSKVLKCGGDKIIVTRQRDGHDVYFNVGDDRDNGSIIDFFQNRTRQNLGQLRKELRGWISNSRKPSPKKPLHTPTRPEPIEKDNQAILLAWSRMPLYSGSYLQSRGITEEIIEAFGVRQDVHGNACVAHIDSKGTLGWETKNKGFTGFSKGGTRAFSLSRLDSGPIKKIVITEAFIDAMSYAQLKHDEGTAYLSTSGTQFSPLQREMLGNMLNKLNVPLHLAMDNDEAGDRMASEMASIAPPGSQIVRDIPYAGKDWNEALEAFLRRQSRSNGLSM